MTNSDDYFGENNKKWNWKDFESTLGFPISAELLDWVVGQDKAIEEAKLCIDEWVRKLCWLRDKEWWKDFEKPMAIKPQPKDWLPAGPFLLLLGDAGTGKSLLGRAMSSYMTKVYKENNLKLYDVLGWRNPTLPSEPKISIHPAGEGKKVIMGSMLKTKKKSFASKWGFKLLQYFLFGFGLTLIGITLYSIIVPWMSNAQIFDWSAMANKPIQESYKGNFMQYLIEKIVTYSPLVLGGASLMFFSIFMAYLGKMMGNNSGTQGIGGATNSNSPKLYIDNSSGRVPFLDATGHGSAQLFGSIAWDPYQTGGLGTPEHQRVTVGDVHRAHLGILFIDEIKNLIGMEAITLLTVLEDGQLPVALRSQFHGGDTAAMSVSTEPVPAMVFLIVAGNLDSIAQIHPALLDRIQGYGKVVYMNNNMFNIVENRQKIVQFISQEVKRFNLLPFSREACKVMVNEARKKSGRNNKLTTKFRPMISIIKTSGVLASNEGSKFVEPKHINEAISEHCKNIHQQMMERMITNMKDYLVIDPSSKPKIGQIYGLAVYHTDNSDDMAGSVLSVKASITEKNKKEEGYFNVTGVEVKENSYIQQSIAKVSHVIQQKYGFSPFDKRCHIDFAQEHGVEGPSAGITMALALVSCITKKKIRQDIAVTGEINIGVNNEIIVTPIGGAHEKITAAQKLGFKKVLIPLKNYEHSIDPKDYTIKVVGCRTLEDYMREILC